MHGLIAKTQETQTSADEVLRGNCRRRDLRRRHCSSCENLAPIGNLRDFDWNFQKALAVAGDEGAAKEGARWLFLHARVEQLLPVAAV
jgi:hypothetical protein